MTAVDVWGRVDELADGTGGSVDAVMGAAIGPYRKSRLTGGRRMNTLISRHGLRVVGRTLGIALASLVIAPLILFTRAEGADTGSKRAIIFVSPGLGPWDSVTAWPRIKAEAYILSNDGYQVSYEHGSIDNIAKSLINARPAAISYFGHGAENNSTMEYLDAATWQRTIYGHLMTYYTSKLSQAEATKRANAETQNFGLELFRNHSCYSLMNTTLADKFVRPGGLYAGVPKSYVPCFTPRMVLQGVDLILTEYRLPAQTTRKAGCCACCQFPLEGEDRCGDYAYESVCRKNGGKYFSDKKCRYTRPGTTVGHCE